MKLSSVFSYADIVDMRNEGLNDDEIIQRAKAKVAYENSPEYQVELKAQEIESAKRKELAQNFANYGISNQDQANLMSGRNTTDEIASKYRTNIQNYEEKQIYKNQAENLANSKQKQIASAIDTVGGGLGEVAAGVAKGATFIPHTIAKFLANNTDSELAKSFYEKSKSARSNLDKAQELYNARTGQDGSLLYKTGEIATEIAADPLTYWMPWMNAEKFAARGAGYALTGGAEGALHEYGSNEKASAEDIATMGGFGALLGLGGGALIEGAIKGGGALYNKYKGAKGASGAETAPNAGANGGNAGAGGGANTQNATPQNANAQMGESLIDGLDNPNLATDGDRLTAGANTQNPNVATQANSQQAKTFTPKTADDADIISIKANEKGEAELVFDGGSGELSKMGVEIAKGEIKSAGAKKLMAIAENSANEVATQAQQTISANIAKINDSSIEFYANNINILNEVAKKYPMLSKSEQIELANKRILQNASPELLAYTRAINGGELPSDARLFGTNAGRMVAKSLEVGATPAEVRDMLLKANIKGELATALAKQLQTRDIAAFGDSMRASEQKLLSQSVQSVRSAARNESVGKILDDAKEQAIKNDEMLKKGVGNQGLDDVTAKFTSEKSGKEFEVAENGFGRELMKYEGKEVNDDAKRAFSAWEAQGDKADITLNDGRKVVYLSPDEAVQLSYGNGYLYGEKDLGALFARKKAESLEQRVERLQSHPAYENLLKMRENTKASELKGDTVGGSKPTVYYEPQSERYLRTKGGGGLPNGERSISITKADVAKLRAGKVDDILATKLENSLEALTGDPYASGLVDHLLTRDYHLASAAKKNELVAKEVAENSSDFSPSGSWKAGYTSIKGKSATGNSRISDEVASDRAIMNSANYYYNLSKKEFEKLPQNEKDSAFVSMRMAAYDGLDFKEKAWHKTAGYGGKNGYKTLDEVKNEIAQARAKMEELADITPIKEFGTNYAEFYHAGGDAVRKLLAEKQGQVAGAFYKDGLGDIDLPWGNSEIGLNKIIQKHSADFKSFGGVEKGLDEIITNGKNLNENGVDTIWYKKGDDYYAIGLSKGFKNKGDNNWIITAYEKKNLNSSQKTKIDEFLNGGDSKTLSAYAEIKSSKTPELTTAKNSSANEIKSQGGGGFKKGFSTQAMTQAMLNVGSGVAGGNIAMANEDDPNKKAQAFMMGFLAGFGGSAGAMKLLSKNATKLAPQLARASEKMAQDFPNLMDKRPDILGGVLGRMNNAKDNFKNIFGGEKALGANKAKLEEAKTMWASDEEIWAKTGWYEDIDGKWKFEINSKGGKLKKEFVDENDKNGDFFEKEIKTQKDLKAMEKYGEVDYEKFKENAKYYRKNYTQKVKDLLLNGSLKNDKLYREYMDNPLGEVKSKYKFRSGFLADILDDKPLFKAYPMLKDIRVRALDGDNGGAYRYGRGSDVLGDIFINFNLNPTAFKSTLYHEIQHAVQHIENFSNGGSPKQWGLEKYQRLAGEAEARNVQARLGTNGKEYPLKTMDIDPNERIVTDEYGYESASYTPKQKEMRGVYNVLKNGKRSTQLYKDITSDLKAVDNIVKFEKGRKDYRTKDGHKNGFGLKHIQKHLDPRKDGYITEQELLNIGEFMRRGKMDYVVENKNGKEIIKRVYESFDDDGTRFRVIIGENEKGDTTISFFSNRKSRTGFTHNAEDYSFNLNGKGNSSANEIKSQGIKEPTNAKSVLNDESRKALKEIVNLGTADASSINDAKARLMLDKHKAKAEAIKAEKGANSAEYKEAKAKANDFEQLWFYKDGSPKLAPSPCKL